MNYILKQTFRHLRQQPLISAVTIAGTALSICLIMIVMMQREVKLADYANEPNRSRTLYLKCQKIVTPDGSESSNSGMTNDMAKDLTANLSAAEAISLSAEWKNTTDVSAPGKDDISLVIDPVNDGFFKVFNLKFVEGGSFSKEECASNAPLAIITRSTARKLFGAEEGVKGKRLFIANHEYRVQGVVEDVSKLMTTVYSDIWVPLCNEMAALANHPLNGTNIYPGQGNVIAIMAKSRADFPVLRKEINRNLAVYNKRIAPDKLDLMEQPDEQETYVNREWSNIAPPMKQIHRVYLMILLILLIVPAINIASMTQSKLRRMEAEIGVRRAFGAKRSTIVWQVMAESMVQSLLAGLLGLVLSLGLCFLLSDYVFDESSFFRTTGQVTLDAGILFSPRLYGWALLFCVVLNLLSSTIPAWRASRKNVAEAIK